MTDESRFQVWVFFTDKPSHAQLSDVVSPRSIRRREKVQTDHNLLSYSDLPVHPDYVEQVAHHVVRVRNRSRWFNAISVVVHRDSIEAILRFPFVREVESAGKYKRQPVLQPEAIDEDGLVALHRSATIDYGLSFEQLYQIGVPAVHDSGNHAENVMIGVFDNGFRLLHHEVFDSMNIVATYDFVDRKTSVVPNNPSSSFGGHGVNSLSVIGGYKPGELVGPAFRAAFVLARTENDSSETPIEEDNWIAAIEWADSIGVDVTSTSLIYRGYDPPYQGWTWEDMDGNTTMITRAADMAVEKGIIVVNAAGNFGSATISGQNTLGAPGDGDSVLTIGSVDASGVRSSFSSVGPTTSAVPRIKPDVMARGSLVRAASSTDPLGYFNGFTGTSAACPLAAGAVALVLNRFPDLDPLVIINALRQTSSNASSPNNEVGWGILNAAAAIGYLEGNPPPTIPAGTPVLLQNFPNPFNSDTFIRYGVPQSSEVRLEIFDVLGRSVRILHNGPAGEGWHEELWDSRDSKGIPVASGAYLVRLSANSGSGNLLTEMKAILIR